MKEIYVRENGTKGVRTVNDKPSMTDQQYKDDCDVNTIIERAKRSGQVSHLAKLQGQFADVSEIDDLHSGMIKLQHAQEAFAKLPLAVKRRFGYDMRSLLEFMDDPSNLEEAAKLGLVKKREKMQDKDGKIVDVPNKKPLTQEKPSE